MKQQMRHKCISLLDLQTPDLFLCFRIIYTSCRILVRISAAHWHRILANGPGILMGSVDLENPECFGFVGGQRQKLHAFVSGGRRSRLVVGFFDPWIPGRPKRRPRHGRAIAEL